MREYKEIQFFHNTVACPTTNTKLQFAINKIFQPSDDIPNQLSVNPFFPRVSSTRLDSLRCFKRLGRHCYSTISLVKPHSISMGPNIYICYPSPYSDFEILSSCSIVLQQWYTCRSENMLYLDKGNPRYHPNPNPLAISDVILNVYTHQRPSRVHASLEEGSSANPMKAMMRQTLRHNGNLHFQVPNDRNIPPVQPIWRAWCGMPSWTMAIQKSVKYRTLSSSLIRNCPPGIHGTLQPLCIFQTWKNLAQKPTILRKPKVKSARVNLNMRRS